MLQRSSVLKSRLPPQSRTREDRATLPSKQRWRGTVVGIPGLGRALWRADSHFVSATWTELDSASRPSIGKASRASRFQFRIHGFRLAPRPDRNLDARPLGGAEHARGIDAHAKRDAAGAGAAPTLWLISLPIARTGEQAIAAGRSSPGVLAKI